MGDRTSTRFLWSCAAVFAVVFGALDGSLVLVHRHLLDEVTRVSEDIFWMAPLAYGLVFLLVAGGLALAGRFIRRPHVHAAAAGVFVGLGTLGLLHTRPILHDGAALLLAGGAGAAVARLVAKRPARFRRFVLRTRVPSIALVAGIVGVTFAHGRLRDRGAAVEASAPPPAAPNIVLLLLDTVRAQSTSLHGRSVQTTPELERIARRGVTFEWAISTAPWTLPSIASLFTGRYPHDLNVGFAQPLDADHPTLAEVLARAGYETAGFVANLLYASREFGLSRGFHHYEDYEVELGQLLLSSSLTRAIVTSTRLRNALGWHELANRKGAAELNGDFLRWLDRRQTDRPFFAFLNYFDAHEPYLPDSPYDVLFGPEPIDRHLWHFGDLKRGNEGRRTDAWLENPDDPWKDLRAYEGAIAQLDAEIGRLFDALEARGELEETIVVIVSDHGEQFGEHGLFYHWNSLYLSLIHVPLVIVYPGVVAQGVRVGGEVSLVDLPATLLDLAATGSAGTIPGRSLRPWLIGDRRVATETGRTPPLSELERGPTFSMVDGGYHYIVVPSVGAEELYDVAADPGEFEDISDRLEIQPRLRRLRELTIQELETPRDAVATVPQCRLPPTGSPPCDTPRRGDPDPGGWPTRLEGA